MAKVDIPFLDRFEEPMLSGQKIATSRGRRMGEIGDWFEAFGASFKIVAVVKTTLFTVCHELYEEEGCAYPMEFEAVWNGIHRRKPYNGATETFLHIFRRIEKGL